MAPTAWNAGFSRHSPPPAGGAASSRQAEGASGSSNRSSAGRMPHKRVDPRRWWAMQDLNLRLLPCEGSTLPLS